MIEKHFALGAAMSVAVLVATTACVVTPDGRVVGFGYVPEVAVVNQGLPPPALEVTVAPPPPQYESVPPLQPGQVWVAGYWMRSGPQWAWRPGYFTPVRTGYTYYPGNWVVRAPGTYSYIPGFWRPAHRPAPRYPYRVYTPGARVKIYRTR